MEPLYIALLTLTLNDAGAVRLSLTDAPDLPTCETQAEAVRTILEGAEYTVVATRCGFTSTVLSPFSHGASAEEEIWHYHVDLAGDRRGRDFLVTPVAPDACVVAPEEQETAFCTVSAQEPE